MEKQLKVYVYEEGEPPVFHDGPCRSIYSMEGRFIHAMETAIRLRTSDLACAKDVSLPEINLQSDAVERQVGGPSASRRRILAFFAGGNHGPVDPALLAHRGPTAGGRTTRTCG